MLFPNIIIIVLTTVIYIQPLPNPGDTTSVHSPSISVNTSSPPLSASHTNNPNSLHQNQHSLTHQHSHQQFPHSQGPPVPTLGPTPQVIRKVSSKRSLAPSQRIPSHYSPTTASSSNSYDWLDTSSFYSTSAPPENSNASYDFINDYNDDNDTKTSMFSNASNHSSHSTTTATSTTNGGNTPSSIITSSSASTANAANSSSNQIANTSTTPTSSSAGNSVPPASRPTTNNTSKRIQVTSFFSSAASPAKPPLNHSNSLPHPGSDESMGDRPMPSYMSLATSANAARSSTLSNSSMRSASTGPDHQPHSALPFSHGSNTPISSTHSSNNISGLLSSASSTLNGSSSSTLHRAASTLSTNTSSAVSTHRTSDPIKDFNISPDVPCYKVLPLIAKKHKVRGDKGELVVCYDDQERMVGLEEMPLKIFRELQAQGKNPVFMIRESTGVKNDVGFVVSGTPGGLL